MDPASLAIAGLVASGISGVTGFIGAQQSAAAQSQQANYASAVARNNQIIADQNARQAAQAGAVQAQNQDFKTRAVVGAVTAAESASGLDIDSPTNQLVRDTARQVGRLDTMTVYNNALSTSRAYATQASNFGAQSQLDTLSAKNASSAGAISGFGSLLSGASGFADKWSRYQVQGLV